MVRKGSGSHPPASAGLAVRGRKRGWGLAAESGSRADAVRYPEGRIPLREFRPNPSDRRRGRDRIPRAECGSRADAVRYPEGRIPLREFGLTRQIVGGAGAEFPELGVRGTAGPVQTGSALLQPRRARRGKFHLRRGHPLGTDLASPEAVAATRVRRHSLWSRHKGPRRDPEPGRGTSSEEAVAETRVRRDSLWSPHKGPRRDTEPGRETDLRGYVSHPASVLRRRGRASRGRQL